MGAEARVAAGRVERGGHHAGVQKTVLLRQRLGPGQRDFNLPRLDHRQRGAQGAHGGLALETGAHAGGEIRVAGFEGLEVQVRTLIDVYVNVNYDRDKPAAASRDEPARPVQ